MLAKIINRPIAVCMVVLAVFIFGFLALRHIPISLMPNIDIPKIIVQANAAGFSVQEVEQKIVTPLRDQIAQVGELKDIQTESKNGVGQLSLYFEPGTNMDIVYVDVNEKIDRVMNRLPKNIERPKVMKAGVMDIPAFFVDIKCKEDLNDSRFSELGQFARDIVLKRLEQLPQTAMVDISGTIKTEIRCKPDMERLLALNITVKDLEDAIKDRDISLETLSIANGIYRYNVYYDSQIQTTQDLLDTYICHDGRLLQLKDLCQIEEVALLYNGLVRNNNQRAITLAVIKQVDAQMEQMRSEIDSLLEELRKEYPDIEFVVTRDQTQLLSYAINSLWQNLIWGVLLASIILFFFTSNWKMPLLVVVSIPLSLAITIACFFLLNISLNIVSLSGLILGIGMIVDNSIIVIDNISQKQSNSKHFPSITLSRNVITGTTEVFTPMLSSILTTCSVFFPLIFFSGSAGAMFHDQAIGVTVALFASLAVASLVVPVFLFHLLNKRHNINTSNFHGIADRYVFSIYEKMVSWTMRHINGTLIVSVLFVVLAAIAFPFIKKEQMPEVSHDDMIMTIDWNEGISVSENDRRIKKILSLVSKHTSSSTAMIGPQQFILSHTKDITANEAVCYLKAYSADDINSIQQIISTYMETNFPESKLDFSISGNIYDLIFNTDIPDLIIRLKDSHGQCPSVSLANSFISNLRDKFPDVEIQPLPTEKTIVYETKPEKLALYNISYYELYDRIKGILNSNRVYDIIRGAEKVAVTVGSSLQGAYVILHSTIKNSNNVDVPMNLLLNSYTREDYKRIYAGAEGEFLPIIINHHADKTLHQVMEYTNSIVDKMNLSATFSGNYFNARHMIVEMTIALVVAVLLLLFILAAQFESVVQPLIILSEIIIDISVVILSLLLLKESINLMSMIGLIVMGGIVINDSILKIDTINRLRHSGHSLLHAILKAGKMRFKPIVITSATTIFALIPFMTHNSLGEDLQYPLSLTLIIGLFVGTMISLFYIPILYFLIYKKKHSDSK